MGLNQDCEFLTYRIPLFLARLSKIGRNLDSKTIEIEWEIVLGLAAVLEPTAGQGAAASRAWAWAGAWPSVCGLGQARHLLGQFLPAIWVSINARLDTATGGELGSPSFSLGATKVSFTSSGKSCPPPRALVSLPGKESRKVWLSLVPL